jgi:CubicO group peptidase (beta-lactamase class C family)
MIPRSRLVVRLIVLAVGTVTLVATPLRAQHRDRSSLVALIDSVARDPIEAGRVAGMSIAVVHGGDTIVLHGYGSADVELDVATPANAIYEIGSVTKQFTAVAVLQLEERGLLSLDDDITTYLPDYPTQGHAITVRRLLDHTSGIKGYTEMPAFWSRLATRRLPRDSLVAMFAAQPFDFPPGEALIYNNSAYFLLGLIVAKASGQSYETYVQQHVLDAAGMEHSRYCSDAELMAGRTRGYQRVGDGLHRAQYIDHTWPYAAGSLCSTVGDLIAWNRALHGTGAGGPLLGPDAYRDLITPGSLNDRTPLRYAKGLAITTAGQRRLISHGGGIFGFVSELRYYPDDDLTIAVLINTAGGASPGGIASAIEEAVLGPRAEPPDIAFQGDLEQFLGTYRGRGRGRPLTIRIGQDDAGLTVTIGTRTQPLRYVEGMSFAAGSARYVFIGERGAITGLKADQVSGYYTLQKQTG